MSKDMTAKNQICPGVTPSNCLNVVSAEIESQSANSGADIEKNLWTSAPPTWALPRPSACWIVDWLTSLNLYIRGGPGWPSPSRSGSVPRHCMSTLGGVVRTTPSPFTGEVIWVTGATVSEVKLTLVGAEYVPSLSTALIVNSW